MLLALQVSLELDSLDIKGRPGGGVGVRGKETLGDRCLGESFISRESKRFKVVAN